MPGTWSSLFRNYLLRSPLINCVCKDQFTAWYLLILLQFNVRASYCQLSSNADLLPYQLAMVS